MEKNILRVYFFVYRCHLWARKILVVCVCELIVCIKFRILKG